MRHGRVIIIQKNKKTRKNANKTGCYIYVADEIPNEFVMKFP